MRPPEFAMHLKQDCAHRWLPCPNGCGLKVRAVDVPVHVDGPGPPGSRCGLAPEHCDACGESMQLRDLEKHREHECPMRKVRCGLCAAEVLAGALDAHKRSACPVRTVRCPNPNCFKELPVNQMLRHSQRDCRKRTTRCLQGCGAIMPIKRLERHMSHRCGKRYLDCPLGCGLRLRAEEEFNHVERECVRRHASRRPGSG